MSDDLKERLSGSCYLAFENGTNDYSAAQEALDCIEELVKERDLWKSRYEHHNHERLETLSLNAMQASKIGSLMNTITKLEKKISEMEKK